MYALAVYMAKLFYCLSSTTVYSNRGTAIGKTGESVVLPRFHKKRCDISSALICQIPSPRPTRSYTSDSIVRAAMANLSQTRHNILPQIFLTSCFL